MKAKEYAKEISCRLELEDSCIVVDWLLKSFIAETNALITSRKPQVNSAFMGIFEELDDKWRALSDRLGGFPAVDGYRRLVKEVHPGVYYFWMQHRRQTADSMQALGASGIIGF